MIVSANNPVDKIMYVEIKKFVKYMLLVTVSVDTLSMLNYRYLIVNIVKCHQIMQNYKYFQKKKCNYEFLFKTIMKE